MGSIAAKIRHSASRPQTARSGDGVDASRRHPRAKVKAFEPSPKEASVEQATTIGLIAHVEDPSATLPDNARSILKLIDTFTTLEAQIHQLDGEINRRSKADPVALRLMTIPGVGPI